MVIKERVESIKLINNFKKIIQQNKKETALLGIGISTLALDSFLTYINLNGDPSKELLNSLRELMIQYGIGPALIYESFRQTAIVTVAMGVGKYITSKYPRLYPAGNILLYGAPTYLTIIHAIGSMSYYFDIPNIADIWNDSTFNTIF